MTSITIKESMTSSPIMVNPYRTVKEAASIMKKNDIGILPVGTPEAVIGIITDRDITVRVTAEGKDASKVKVQDAMTKKLIICDENDDIEHAAELMRKHDVSRIMVSKLDKITGIVTIADLLRNKGDRREGDKVLHHLLGRKTPQRKPSIAGAAAGYESYDA